jgi:hypothetical protein
LIAWIGERDVKQNALEEVVCADVRTNPRRKQTVQMPGRYSAAPMVGPIQCDFAVQPKMNRLKGMDHAAKKPSRRKSSAFSPPRFSEYAGRIFQL